MADLCKSGGSCATPVDAGHDNRCPAEGCTKTRMKGEELCSIHLMLEGMRFEIQTLAALTANGYRVVHNGTLYNINGLVPPTAAAWLMLQPTHVRILMCSRLRSASDRTL